MESSSQTTIRALGATFVALAMCVGAGCTVDDINVNLDDASINVDRVGGDDDVEPGASVELDLEVDNVELTEPSAMVDTTVTAAGHIQVYFDSLDSQPILITAETHVSVTIPADATPGDHRLLCRVHKHDGTPTETVEEIDITVRAEVSSS